jgi:uncharacterized protein
VGRQSVAVVGAGVSGMTAAYLLQRRYDVTVFESRGYLGGNADTRQVRLRSGDRVPVDTAFMAYGKQTYPNFQRLLSELGVDSHPAHVAVDVHCTSCGFTHVAKRAPGDPPTPQPPPRVDTTLWARFTAELERFPREAAQVPAPGQGPALSIEEFLAKKGYSDYFFQHFIYPHVAPWFLSDPGSVRVMSMGFLMDALRRYGTLNSAAGSESGTTAAAGWHAITGGSRVYLARIAEQLSVIRTGTPVQRVRRLPGGVLVQDSAGQVHTFGKAVIAVPPPTALELLGQDATARERELLSEFRYTRMTATLHTDDSVFPSTSDTRSGISMQVSCDDLGAEFRGCTIDANVLQGLDTAQPIVISYNPADPIAEDKVTSRTSYEHPVFTVAAFAAQRRLPELADDRLAFAGSYFGSAVHEDGCAAGVQAAAALGALWPEQ